jgi:glutathione S-transferase
MEQGSGITLYTQEFDAQSQRPIIALNEAEIAFKHVEIPFVNPPSWLFSLSPQGSLPACKVGDQVVHGVDAINSFLEKEFPKIAKLLISKRKNYSAMLLHCRTKFEVAVDDLFTNEDDSKTESLREVLMSELDFLESIIKGPYILGKELSWVCHQQAAIASCRSVTILLTHMV